jgi:hypothetical protein
MMVLMVLYLLPKQTAMCLLLTTQGCMVLCQAVLETVLEARLRLAAALRRTQWAQAVLVAVVHWGQL